MPLLEHIAPLTATMYATLVVFLLLRLHTAFSPRSLASIGFAS